MERIKKAGIRSFLMLLMARGVSLTHLHLPEPVLSMWLMSCHFRGVTRTAPNESADEKGEKLERADRPSLILFLPPRLSILDVDDTQ